MCTIRLNTSAETDIEKKHVKIAKLTFFIVIVKLSYLAIVIAQCNYNHIWCL